MRPRFVLFLALAIATALFAGATTAGALTRTASSLSVSVSASPSSISPGQVSTVRARATTAKGGTVGSSGRAWVTITDPLGKVVVSSAVARYASGYFTYRWTSPAIAAAGSWRAVVRVSSQGSVTSGSTGITVTAVTPPPPPPTDPSAPHAALNWSEYPANCLSCHPSEFSDAYQGVHYQWQGSAPENTNRPDLLQGKLTNEMNSYCVNILGNWQICGKCHAGRGAIPVWTSAPTREQLLNVDCLVCHNMDYANARTRLANGSMGVTSTDTVVLDSYVRNIAEPTRASCLKCHAYAGGGDAVKRGDLAWASANTTDRTYDVHLATTGANLTCQQCHTWSKHKVTGRGSDISVTDNPGEIRCSTASCHPTKASASGHGESAIGRHVARVACQTCHIPEYGRNAADSAATEATEIDRNWLTTNTLVPKPWHPGTTKANDLTPVYKWWNGTSYLVLLGDQNMQAEADGTYATSKPNGSVSDASAKLYPFKYKTATQPMRTVNRMLVALNTLDYMTGSGNPATATSLGLQGMGYLGTDAVQWVRTSTYQALNHQVAPKSTALDCTVCHGSTARLDLQGDLGYGLKDSEATVCTQCHERESDELSFTSVHDKHVKDKGYDCSWCHNFSRPERGLRRP